MKKFNYMEMTDDGYKITVGIEDEVICNIHVCVKEGTAEKLAKELAEMRMKADMEWEQYDFEEENGNKGVGYTFSVEDEDEIFEAMVELCHINDFVCVYEMEAPNGGLDTYEEKIEEEFKEFFDTKFEEIEELEEQIAKESSK
uniref:Uncharacterized protein n=1 Tax=Hirondellea gigas TaxID=1518452 RepID=A0A6A7GEK2_9CRUS